jgi:hypothetical protein
MTMPEPKDLVIEEPTMRSDVTVLNCDEWVIEVEDEEVFETLLQYGAFCVVHGMEAVPHKLAGDLLQEGIKEGLIAGFNTAVENNIGGTVGRLLSYPNSKLTQRFRQQGSCIIYIPVRVQFGKQTKRGYLKAQAFTKDGKLAIDIFVPGTYKVMKTITTNTQIGHNNAKGWQLPKKTDRNDMSTRATKMQD